MGKKLKRLFGWLWYTYGRASCVRRWLRGDCVASHRSCGGAGARPGAPPFIPRCACAPDRCLGGSAGQLPPKSRPFVSFLQSVPRFLDGESPLRRRGLPDARARVSLLRGLRAGPPRRLTRPRASPRLRPHPGPSARGNWPGAGAGGRRLPRSLPRSSEAKANAHGLPEHTACCLISGTT